MIMSTKQIYEYLNRNIGINKVRDLLAQGEIKSFYLGNKLVAYKIDVEKYIRNISNIQN